jgi:hypothetical protein
MTAACRPLPIHSVRADFQLPIFVQPQRRNIRREQRLLQRHPHLRADLSGSSLSPQRVDQLVVSRRHQLLHQPVKHCFVFRSAPRHPIRRRRYSQPCVISFYYL